MNVVRKIEDNPTDSRDQPVEAVVITAAKHTVLTEPLYLKAGDAED